MAALPWRLQALFITGRGDWAGRLGDLARTEADHRTGNAIQQEVGERRASAMQVVSIAEVCRLHGRLLPDGEEQVAHALRELTELGDGWGPPKRPWIGVGRRSPPRR